MATIQERSALYVAAIGEYPLLPENTTGSGPQIFEAPRVARTREFLGHLGWHGEGLAALEGRG